jgi:YesN/AraC family two-component response regulator
MYNNKFRFVGLSDRMGHSLFGTKDNQSFKKGEIATQVVSAYTGWEIRSGLLKGSLIKNASILSSFWTLLGFVAFTFGIASIVFVTRRNYKPIDELLSRIRSYPANKISQFSLQSIDEFAFIGSTLDEMREQSEKFQQQYEDDVRVRIKLFFHQLVNGFQNLTSADWTEAMESTVQPIDFQLRQVGIAELDQFSNFQQRYDRKDQDLIKFVISKALQEIMQQHQLPVWSEWTSKDQLSCMVTLCILEDEERCKQAYAQLQVWVHDYLNQTLTIGLGSAVKEPVHLSISYQEAHKALQFKMVAGYNSILPYVTYGRRHTSKGDLLTYTPLLKKTIDLLGIDEMTWKISLQQLFTRMNQDQLPREHIHIILHDYLYRLDSELTQSARMDMELWKSIELPRLQQVVDLSETLGEIHSAFMGILPKSFERVKATLEGNKTKELIQQVKEYIEQNFRKPDLSLEHLGQLFDMNPKYLSQLFKNGYGQGFIDFLINIRICQAQEYLIETDWEVQEIAEKVGYVNPISFRRTFKKTVGLSPGEFRKCKGRATLS